MAGAAAVLEMGRVARSPSGHNLSWCLLIVLILGIPNAYCIHKLYLKEKDLFIILNSSQSVRLVQIGQYTKTLKVTAIPQHPEIVEFIPESINIYGDKKPSAVLIATHYLYAFGKHPGYSEVSFHVEPPGYVSMDSIFLRVTVLRSSEVRAISSIIGWLYFAAWSFSFYPQIYINYTRKSVVGLNPDYLAMNIVGFILYSMFNCGLYFNEAIQMEYFRRYPRGHNPVHLNDVFFSLHAALATLLTITQSMRYAHADQRVSVTARILLGIMVSIVIISAGCSVRGSIDWLDFLYHCSYIQLVTMLFRYMPQAIMNYRRKSTVGWSIGNIILDFTGGVMSVLQIILNAWNYNDWLSIFGAVTKFGLGLFILLFDLFFMLQHYVLYRKLLSPVFEELSPYEDK